METSPFKPSSPWEKVDPGGSFDCFRRISNTEKAWLAKDALSGGCFIGGKDAFGKEFHTWLRWVQSGDARATLWWSWLDEHPDPDIPKRDAYVSRLWHSMNDEHEPNKLAQLQVTKELTPWPVYERHFFNWFLTRYNVTDARGVFRKNWVGRYVHWPLSLLTLGVVTWFFCFTSRTGCEWLTTLLGILLIFILGNIVVWMEPSYYLQSLMPRMAVTTGLGYLYLFSAGGLMATIYKNQLEEFWQISIAMALIFVVLFYMIQVIQRRVVPRLSFWHACGRAFHLLGLGIAYSAIGLFISAPILFSRFFDATFVDKPLEEPARLLVSGAIALTIGVVSQLVWDDKPVTEPL